MNRVEKLQKAAKDWASLLNEHGEIESSFKQGAEWMERELQAENAELRREVRRLKGQRMKSIRTADFFDK